MKKKAIISILCLAFVLIFTNIIPVNNIKAESEDVTIKFEDENLYKEVKRTLNSSSNKIEYDDEGQNTIKMKQENIDKVKSLFVTGDKVTDIGGIENFTNLEHLQLNGNPVSDISKISNLKKLTDLKLKDTNVKDISVLNELTGLKTLALENVKTIESFEPLKALINLENLNLTNTNIRDLSFISGLTKLKQLYLEKDELTSIDELKDLVKLTELKLSDNNISDISVMANWKDKFGKTALVHLNINNNQISDVSVLADFHSLHYLYIKNNKVDDFSILDNELKGTQSFTYWMNEQTLKIVSSNRTVSLPKIFLQAQESTSGLYSKESLKLEDCVLDEGNQSVTVNEDKNTATVKIPEGKAKDTILTINIVDPLELNLSKTPVEMTKENVKATITSNKEIDKESVPEGWTLSEDKRTLTKEYEKNVEEEVVTLKDVDGLTSSLTVTVDNIDKEPPQIEYTTKENEDGSVEVTLKSNEKLNEEAIPEGWTLSEDKITLTKTYTKTTEEEISIQDLVGNKTNLSVKVTIKDKTTEDGNNKLEADVTQSDINNTSNTPNTGDIVIYSIVALIVAVSIIVISNKYVKSRKNNN